MKTERNKVILADKTAYFYIKVTQLWSLQSGFAAGQQQ